MIEISNLTKKFGSITAVDNVSFTVEKGEILGFLGPNGAGKSTTMNMITGYLPATEGTIKVCGFDIMENPKEVKKRIGFLPEIPPLYVDMTVEEYLSFVCDLKLVSKEKKHIRINEIMERVKLTNVKGRLIKNLSKGYKQRVGLAQALVGDPEVLILDEPTVGLDPKEIIEIRNLIKSLGKEHTVIISSHILPEVSAVCERVVIINKGQIVAVDTPENLSKAIGASSKVLATIEGDKERITNAIKSISGIVNVNEASVQATNGATSFIIESENEADIKKALFMEMAKIECPILELKPVNITLEDIFLQLTTEEGNETPPSPMASLPESDKEDDSTPSPLAPLPKSGEGNQEMENQEMENQEMENQEMENQEMENQEMENQEMENQEMENQETENQETETEAE